MSKVHLAHLVRCCAVASLVLAAGACSSAGFDNPTESSSSAVTVSGKYWEIWNSGTNSCLELSSYTGGPGTFVISAPCNGQANQAWFLDNSGQVHGYGNLCLVNAGGGSLNLVVDYCGNPNEQWTYVFDNNNNRALASTYPADKSSCLTFHGDGNAVRVDSQGNPNCGITPGHIAPASTLDTGLKTPPPVGPTAFIGMKTRCLDVTGYGTYLGTPIQTWDCYAGGPTQQWTFGPASGGYSEIIGYGGNCLTPQGTQPGTPVQMWPCVDVPNQHWAYTLDGLLINQYSGLCVDIAGSGLSNGTQVVLWNCFYGQEQVFEHQW